MNHTSSMNELSVRAEFHHLRSHWWWLFLLGILLVVSGTAAIVFPILATVGAMIFLGVNLMLAGLATIVTSFWAGRWSGTLLQLLVGILYLVAGFAIADSPVDAGKAATLLIAAMFIVAGAFRTLAALVIRFPHWGWALLNGVVTLLCGLVIYRHFTDSGPWLVGLLIGLEMIFNGWTWIMLSVAVRNLPTGSTV
jgi:uncharacterized membrane protein HdeD (DUF308 family)